MGRNADGEIVTVHYHKLIPMLLNELQRQHRQIEQQSQRLGEQQQQIDALTAHIGKLVPMVSEGADFTAPVEMQAVEWKQETRN